MGNSLHDYFIAKISCYAIMPSILSPVDDDDDSKSLLRDCKLENSSTDSQSSYGSRSTNYDSIAITRGVLSTPVEGKKKRGKAINFFKALLIPGVVVVSEI